MVKKRKEFFEETINASRRHRSSRSQRFYKKDILKSFAKLTGKQIYLVVFFDKVAGLEAANLSKKRLSYKCFLVKFAKVLRKPILHNTFRRLLLSTSRIPLKPNKEATRRCSMKYVIFQSPIRTVFSRFLDLDRNLGIVKEKPTRKTCFSRKKKRPAPRIYQAKFCLVVFL